MISVCIATFNGAKYIKYQLNSILAQLENQDEVIISDDCSDDNTVGIIEGINDNRVKLLKNTSKLGIVRNFENSLIHAQGDYIFLADQDDIWGDKKVLTLIRYLEEGYDLLMSDALIVNENGQAITESYFSIVNSKTGLSRNLIKNSYLGCCMAFKRSVLDNALPFPKYIIMHDIWIGLISEILFKPKFIDDKLVLYRRHGDNYSPSAEISKNSLAFKLRYRVNLIIELIKRVGLKFFITKMFKLK